MNVVEFQEKYGLRNREMAVICGCSLPTIQKWRSGDIKTAPTARNLLFLLDSQAGGDAVKLRAILNGTGVTETASARLASEVEPRKRRRRRDSDPLELMLANQRLQRELADAEQRYLQVMNALPEPVCRWKKDTTIVYANPAYRELHQKDGDIIGKKWIDFVPAPERQEILTLVNEFVRRGGVHSSEHLARDKHGRLTYYEWLDLPIHNDKGELLEYHSIGRDRRKERSLGNQAAYSRTGMQVLLHGSARAWMVLDENGRILESNRVLRQRLGPDAVARELTDILGFGLPARFIRLLGELSVGEQLRYRFDRGDLGLILVMTLLHRDGECERYLGELLPPQQTSDSGEQAAILSSRQLMGAAAVGDRQPPADKDCELSTLMHRIGERMNVDRCSLLQFSAGSLTLLASWSRAGEAPVESGLEAVAPEQLSWLLGRMRRGLSVRMDAADKLPSTATGEREAFAAMQVTSILSTPVLAEGDDLIFVHAEQFNQTRKWHDQDVQEMKDYRPLLEQAVRAIHAAAMSKARPAAKRKGRAAKG